MFIVVGGLFTIILRDRPHIPLVIVLIGLVSLVRWLWANFKLKKMKQAGLRYDAEVTGLILLSSGSLMRINHVRLGALVTVCAICAYTDNQDRERTAKSTMFLWPETAGHEKLIAAVYVNPNNPDKYAVELFERQI